MLEFAPGSVGRSVFFLLRDSAFAQPKTSLVYNSSGAKAAYTREGGTSVPITLATLGSPNAAWSSGGFVEMGSNAPGLYRLCVPDAALASGANYVVFTISFDNVLGEGLMVLLRNPVNNAGPGALQHTVTVQTSGAVPIPGAQVWVSSDSAGANVIAGVLVTDSLGHATFLLNAGSYFLWCADPGFSGTNPTVISVG